MSLLLETWNQFKTERAISLCATSLVSDYRQVTKWLTKCPIQDLEQGRQILTWVLSQEPTKSARRVSMYVKGLYKWASSEDVQLIPRNPVLTFRMPKAPQKDEDIIVIPKAETQIILDALKGKGKRSAANWAAYAEFMLQTGMRTGEVRALKWGDIDEGRVLVHANYTLTHGYKPSTKTNKKRSVPLNVRCVEILSQQPSDTEYIFPYNRYAFQSWFYDRMKEAHSTGLISHRYRPYDLRHSAITRWIEAGIPVAQVAQWAGNTAEMIWNHYCGVTEESEMPII
jgi:integrase